MTTLISNVKLEQNYRSTQTIVNAANSVIKHKNQIKKTVFSKNGVGDIIKVCKTMSDNEEGQIVVQSIFETQMNNQCLTSLLYFTEQMPSLGH